MADPKRTMATSGDCPGSESQVISILVCKNLYLNTGNITESRDQPGVIALSLDLGRWPPTMVRLNAGNAVSVRGTVDILNWAL